MCYLQLSFRIKLYFPEFMFLPFQLRTWGGGLERWGPYLASLPRQVERGQDFLSWLKR